MKLVIYLMTLISIMSCSSEPKNVSMEKVTPIFNANLTELTRGEWKLCKTMNGGSIVNYNQCPKLIFNSSSFGFYVKPSSKQIAFNWKLLNQDSLSIIVVEADMENESIKRGIYEIVFSNKSKYRELQLKHTGTHLIYFLGK